MTAGYSGTPLAKKLSLKAGMRVWWDGMPESVAGEIASEGLDLSLLNRPEAPLDVAHIFVTERAALESKLHELLPLLGLSGFIWVSWPKKAAKKDTDITEDTVREVALPMGLVDIKVCAVDATWSALKLVIRKDRRSQFASQPGSRSTRPTADARLSKDCPGPATLPFGAMEAGRCISR